MINLKEQNTLYNGNQEQINSKISIINELFHKMNLQGRSENNVKQLEIKLTSDQEEPPEPSLSIKAYQLNKTQSEFQKYLQRKQRQIQTPTEAIISDNTFDDKEEDLLTDIRAVDCEVNVEKQVPISKNKVNTINCYSNQSKSFSQQTNPNQTMRNHAENVIQTICTQKLCKLPKRDLMKLNKNKEIIDQAYSIFVEGNSGNQQSYSPGCKNIKGSNSLIKPTKSVENLTKLQATIKKNYFRY